MGKQLKIPVYALELVQEALKAKASAYAPYSNFPVGAALYTEDKKIITGANVENASYGLTVCAERNAIMQAVLCHQQKFKAIAIATNVAYTPPCGMCLQVLSEFVENCIVFLVGQGGEIKETSLKKLLPQSLPPHMIKKIKKLS